jgi:hypothetical protein
VFNNEKTGQAKHIIEKSDWVPLEQLFTVLIFQACLVGIEVKGVEVQSHAVRNKPAINIVPALTTFHAVLP